MTPKKTWELHYHLLQNSRACWCMVRFILSSTLHIRNFTWRLASLHDISRQFVACCSARSMLLNWRLVVRSKNNQDLSTLNSVLNDQQWIYDYHISSQGNITQPDDSYWRSGITTYLFYHHYHLAKTGYIQLSKCPARDMICASLGMSYARLSFQLNCSRNAKVWQNHDFFAHRTRLTTN